MQNMFICKVNLGASPELKRINGKNGEFTVASMSVMFARWGQNEQGDLEQVGGFWREVEIFGEKAEACAKHLRKGARVLVIGEEREFMARDESTGEQVQVMKIVADMWPCSSRASRRSRFKPLAREKKNQSENLAFNVVTPQK